MECKVARYWISLYIDKELDNETETKLLEHINKCKECNIYFKRALDMAENIEKLFNIEEYSSERICTQIMSNIKAEKKSYEKKTRYKKLAICAAVLIGLLLTVPIDGKTAFAHVNDWAKSFVIRKPGLTIKVEDIDKAPDRKPTNGTHIKPQISKKTYYSTKDLIENVYVVENKPCLPEYLPPGYEFKYAKYEKYLNENLGDFDIRVRFERKSLAENTSERMDIIIYYKNENSFNKGAIYFTDDHREAKAVEIDGEDAILTREKSRNGLSIYRLAYIMTKYPVKIRVHYMGHREGSIVEEEIIKTSNELVKQIQKEVPKNNKEDIEYKSISELIESVDENEFYDKIYKLDDRIVKIDNIPEGYKFNSGSFINNPKEKSNISSDYHAIYKKDNSTINIKIDYYNYTNRDSDFPSYQIGEVEKREDLLGYEMKVYKERKDITDTIRAISITLRDYSMVININTKGSKNEIINDEDIKKIAIEIIGKVKQAAEKRKFVDREKYIKTYDSVEHLKGSPRIVSKGFVVPTYKPKGYEFMRVNYTNNGYMLQFIGKRNSSDSENKLVPVITISEKVGDITQTRDGKYVSSIDKITILGYEGYVVKEEQKYPTKEKVKIMNKIRLELEVPQKNHLIEASIFYHEGEEGFKDELVKLVESMLIQID